MIVNAAKNDHENSFSGIVKFNDIKINIGGAMTESGFVAPCDGTYKFTFSANTAIDNIGEFYMGVLKKKWRYRFSNS